MNFIHCNPRARGLVALLLESSDFHLPNKVTNSKEVKTKIE